MAETPNLHLPLVASAQTQKHITVNESLVLLDALLQGQLTDINQSSPPVAPDFGAIYGVGSGATGDWQGQDGSVAIWTEGGWRFVTPKEGWAFFNPSVGQNYRFVSGTWQADAVQAPVDGALTSVRTVTHDHILAAGAQSVTADIIPSHAHVIGVTARVISEVTTDTGTSWSLGVAGADDRYGTGYGFALGSYAKGLTSSGLTYYADTGVQLSCNGGAFTGGSVRIAIHYLEITEPA